MTDLIPTCASTDPIRSAAGRRPFQSSTRTPFTSNLPESDNWTDLMDVRVPKEDDSFRSSQRLNKASAAPSLYARNTPPNHTTLNGTATDRVPLPRPWPRVQSPNSTNDLAKGSETCDRPRYVAAPALSKAWSQ